MSKTSLTEIKEPKKVETESVESSRQRYQKYKSYHQKYYQENKKVNTKTKCVICGNKTQSPKGKYRTYAIPKKTKENKKVQSIKKPILTQCFKCEGYYTEKEEDRDKYICEKCMVKLYFQDKDNYKKLITSKQKRQATKLHQLIMGGKNKNLKNFTDEELLAEIIVRSGSTKGLPTKARCFYCHRDFWIK
ncbi:10376_t:CDS:2 [Funneliformis geosporum]|nr:10376_t:CDS:2 [Funneliformis geosporum]